MAFNHKFPDAVPALDMDSFLKAISDPQGTAKLWEQYKVARKEYEALRASVKAEIADLEDKLIFVSNNQVALEKAKEGFSKEVADFDAAKKAWVKQRNAVEDQMAKREAACDDRDAFFTNKEAELTKRTNDFNEWQKARQALVAKRDSEFLEREAAIADREAAVAAREKKAEELAKLLKSV